VRIENEKGALVARAVVSDTQRPGEVFAAMHWTQQFSSAGAVGRLVHDKTDPVSGQPDLKGSTVRISAIKPSWAAMLLCRGEAVPDLPEGVYWSKVPIGSGFAFELAGWLPLAGIIHSEDVLRRLLQIPAGAELVTYSDMRKGVFRYAGFIGNRLEACLYLATRKSELPARAIASDMLGRALDAVQRIALLAACAAESVEGADQVVCACFSICRRTIVTAIRERNLKSTAEIGTLLEAGTNCGSCIPELRQMLPDVAAKTRISGVSA
jgi:assimilatory nitrate reductase catalytic subunit